MTGIAIILLIAVVAAAIILPNKLGKKKSADSAAAPAAKTEADGAVRPAQYDAGPEAAMQDRILVPEIDDDFDDEKTMAIPDEDETVFLDDDDDDKTMPLFGMGMAKKPAPSVTFTGIAGGRTVTCTGETFSVGKSPTSSDYVISENQRISRKHATFYRKNGLWYVVDCSKNGTMVNGKAAAPGEYAPVLDGDTIAFADEEFAFSIKA